MFDYSKYPADEMKDYYMTVVTTYDGTGGVDEDVKYAGDSYEKSLECFEDWKEKLNRTDQELEVRIFSVPKTCKTADDCSEWIYDHYDGDDWEVDVSVSRY